MVQRGYWFLALVVTGAVFAGVCAGGGTLLLMPGSSVVYAAPPSQEETTYLVQAGDNLWKLAEEHLGNGALYPALVAATNERHRSDSSYANIADPTLIQAGWKLLIPAEVPEGVLAAPVPPPAPAPTPTRGVVRLDLDKIFPPPIEMRDLVIQTCNNCHTIVPVLIYQMPRGQWEKKLADHKTDCLPGLDDEDFEAMLEYLIVNFGPDSPVPELPPELTKEGRGWPCY